MKLSSSQRFWSSPGHLLFRYVPPASADGPAKGTRGEQEIIGSRAGVPPKPVMWWTLMEKGQPSQALERKQQCSGLPAIFETPIQCVRVAVGCVLKGVCSNAHKPQDPKQVREHQATVIFLYLKKGGGVPSLQKQVINREHVEMSCLNHMRAVHFISVPITHHHT